MKDKIKTIVWDLDNTLYKFDFDIEELWHAHTVEYVLQNGLDMDREEAIKIARDGWLNYRHSGYHFINDYGFNARDIHIGVNNLLPQTMINPCAETPDLMQNMRDYKHVILTFAIRDWAHRVLDHTQLSEFFEPNYILGAEDYDFEDKAYSARGILTALDKIGGNADEVMFVEDTLPNLKPAKEQAGVNTVYLHHGRPMNDNDMDFVDLKVTDTPELLKWFKEVPEA